MKIVKNLFRQTKSTPSCILNQNGKFPSYILRNPNHLTGKDTCLVAIYAPLGSVSDATAEYIKILSEHGFNVIACIAVDDITLSMEVGNLEAATGIVVRLNGGMDFSLWSCAVCLIPEVWEARRLVFTNDSIIALPDLFEAFSTNLRSQTANCVFLTESYEIHHHGQSYFFLMQGEILNSLEHRRFWQGLQVLERKQEVIDKYEINMLDLVESKLKFSSVFLYSFDKIFSGAQFNELKFNVTHAYWEYLVSLGFPFVKVDLLRDNVHNFPILHWKSVLSRYGVNIAKVESHLFSPRARKKVERKRWLSGIAFLK